MYIGQAGSRKNGEGVLFRVAEHLKDEFYFTEAVMFTTSDNSWGPTEISYLENKFTNLAIRTGRYTVKNGNEPNPGNVTEEKGGYEVIRDDGKVAVNLSEGERNFIAFLYFYYVVRGMRSETDSGKNKIVVIDDPVSSMDSSALFIVGSPVREMIGICANVADPVENENPIFAGRYIEQIFILTHNAYFH